MKASALKQINNRMIDASVDSMTSNPVTSLAWVQSLGDALVV
jgi:hypothetical protein